MSYLMKQPSVLLGRHTEADRCNPFVPTEGMQFCAGGVDLAQGDRDDLQQLDKAVRGRLLELQILKLSAQCKQSQAQHATLLDVGSSAQPKVPHQQMHHCLSLISVLALPC